MKFYFCQTLFPQSNELVQLNGETRQHLLETGHPGSHVSEDKAQIFENHIVFECKKPEESVLSVGREKVQQEQCHKSNLQVQKRAFREKDPFSQSENAEEFKKGHQK